MNKVQAGAGAHAHLYSSLILWDSLEGSPLVLDEEELEALRIKMAINMKERLSLYIPVCPPAGPVEGRDGGMPGFRLGTYALGGGGLEGSAIAFCQSLLGCSF